MLREVKPILDSRFSILGKEIFPCLCSAFLLICAFPRSNIEFFAWIGFIPLFCVLKKKSRLKVFLLSYFTGIIFWFGTIYWLVHVTFLGMVLLVLYLALYFGLFGLIISSIKNRVSSIEVLFFSSIWVILEYARSHILTGFPWALLGYSQYRNLPVIQVSDITGAWGVSFLVMMVNAAIYSTLNTQYSILERAKKIIIPILCIMITLIYGFYKIYRKPNTENQTSFKVSVIQGNIPQELKWDARAKEFIIKKYFGLTAEALKDKADLLIWPEASLPVALEQEPEYIERVKDFARKIGKPLLLGAVTIRDDDYYNSAVLVSSKGELSQRYDKVHLVPFGEYIPLRKMFVFLESIVPIGDFEMGKEYTVFALNARPLNEQAGFSTLICFEDVFPELSRKFVKRGARFLVNITNDAWFKETSAPYQHLQCSVFRAVENRVPLVRSANTGVSAFISPTGNIVSKVANARSDIFVDGYATEEISVMDKKLSFYARYGDVFILACFIYSLLYLCSFALKR